MIAGGKERPMLFSAPMVRALLDGSKTQTRRIVKPQPQIDAAGNFCVGKSCYGQDRAGRPVTQAFVEWHCPHGKPGDRVWARENYRFLDSFDKDRPTTVGDLCLAAGYDKPWAPTQYDADGERRNWMQVGTPPHAGPPVPGKCRPSIHMPRWASRILLEIVSVRVEQLHKCSEADAISEGIAPNWCGDLEAGPNGFGGQGWVPDCGWQHYLNGVDGDPAYTATESYRSLWESINGAGSWAANPWVWVIEFKRVCGNER